MASRSEPAIGGLPRLTAITYVLLFAVAFAGYYLLWRNTPAVDGDTPQYLEVAKDLADSHLAVLHDRTIGYPLLLAATGATVHATHSLLAVSLLLHFASVWLLAVVLSAAGIGRRWLLVFGVLLLLPLYVEPAGWVQTENLAQFTLVVGFACLVLAMTRARVILLGLSGLAIGGAALTRPVYQALAPTLAAVVLALPVVVRRVRLRRRDALKAAAALVGAAMVVLGVMGWVNYAKFNYFGLVPSLGFHLSTKTMAFVERLPDEYAPVREIFVRERDAQLVTRGSVHTGSQTVWSVRPQLSAATGLSQIALSHYLLRMNLALIRKAPVEYLQEVARSMAVYWFPPATPLASMHSSLLRWTWGLVYVAVVVFFFAQVMVFAGVGLFELSARVFRGTARRAPASGATAMQIWAYVLAGAIVVYTMLLTCFIDIGDPRQRRPTDVLVVFLCFLGAHLWHQGMRRGFWGPAFGPLDSSRTEGSGSDVSEDRGTRQADGLLV